MNRDVAIEAAVKAIEALRFTATAEDFATAAIDAATPHLVGEPIQWIVLNHHGSPAWSGIKDQEEALNRARRWNEGRPADSRYRVVALVPVEDQP